MRRPWFAFYVDDFETSGRVKLMTNAEKGCYVTLLSYQWREGFVPSEIVDLARICGEPPSVFKKYWKRLESCFPVGDDGRRRNDRQQAERQKAELISSKRQAIAKGLDPHLLPDLPPHVPEISTVPVNTQVTRHKSHVTEKPTSFEKVGSNSDSTREPEAARDIASRVMRKFGR